MKGTRRIPVDEEKKARRMKVIVAVFFAFIMTSSVIGFIFSDQEQTGVERYGKFKFVRDQQYTLYHSNIDGRDYTFYNLPGIVNSTQISPAFISSLKTTKMAYFTSSNDSMFIGIIGQAQYDLAKALSERGGLLLKTAYTNANPYGAPVINCANATQYVPVIEVLDSNQTSLSEVGNCLVLNAISGDDVMRMRDRLLYSILGVI